MNEPCDFVKLVLNRMDSNPDEFEHYGRWNTLCEALERHAGMNSGNAVSGRNALWAYDQFEIDLMLAKYRKIYRDSEYKNMLKNLLVGAEPKAEGLLVASKYQNITPQQLVGNGTTIAGSSGLIGAALGSGQQYAANTTATGLNAQLRSQMDDMIEAKMQGFKRG